MKKTTISNKKCFQNIRTLLKVKPGPYTLHPDDAKPGSFVIYRQGIPAIWISDPLLFQLVGEVMALLTQR